MITTSFSQCSLALSIITSSTVLLGFILKLAHLLFADSLLLTGLGFLLVLVVPLLLHDLLKILDGSLITSASCLEP